MTTTTHVVNRTGWWAFCQRHGYFFRASALMTIAFGFCLHLYRVIFGDEMAVRFVVTPTVDKVLLVPMTCAAVAGILSWRSMRFRSRAHRVVVTVAIAYITISVPLHVYCSYVLGDVSFFVTYTPVWFSYLLLCVVYPTFLTMLWRLRYRH